MPTIDPPQSPRRSRLLSNRLWLLAAALGVASTLAVAFVIHDSRRLQAAAQSVARATAEQVAALTSGRIELLALETFAPVTPWSVQSPVPGRAAVNALVAAQREAQRCACRDTLPATEFFRFDPATGALDTSSVVAARALLPEVLARIARARADRPRVARQSSIHLTGGPPVSPQVVVTVVQYNSSGSPAAVYGLVAPARQLFAGLFDHQHTPQPNGAISIGVSTLDTASLRIQTLDSAWVFGTIGMDHRFLGTVMPTGPLEGLAVTVGLSTLQIPLRLFVSRSETWHLGLLGACTVLVIGFAVGTSRRELLLARARSDFIAGVSHDLRMPLAQILIASETIALHRERDDGDRVTLASSIVREARRLIGLVDNVMLFSRSGTVELRPRLASLSVEQLFADTAEAVKLAVDDAKQTMTLDADASITVLADRQLIRQALVNLVDNALKYGAPGQRIRLSARQHSAALVRLHVEDEGPGIPAEQRGRVFEPYERLARDQDSERTGTGLGLAVVYQIARVCEGRVWLEAGERGGTRAVLELRSAVMREPAAVEHAGA
jgi:signal transduction histidine kinase